MTPTAIPAFAPVDKDLWVWSFPTREVDENADNILEVRELLVVKVGGVPGLLAEVIEELVVDLDVVPDHTY